MSNFYCEYCGQKFSNTSGLNNSSCSRHPEGSNKGKHKLYEGTEKSSYNCKFCSQKFSSLIAMGASTCSRHPNGSNKGKHSPEL
jgi:DNA-directed RNA polymerase subunit RPC12/RpoP